MRTIVDRILPTTMVGSYPRPQWFQYQLLGRDLRAAFKHVGHAEAFSDATLSAVRDQEAAGLDIVTDGQMCFDDYVGVIGSFCWYMYERIPGFEPAKEEHPIAVAPERWTKEVALLSDWGGVGNSGPVREGRCVWPTSTRSPPPMPPSRSRCRWARAPSISPGTSTSSTTRTRAGSPRRWCRSSTQ